MGWWYTFMTRGIGVPLFRGVLRTTVIGAETVPPAGPAIIAFNHFGGVDILVIPALLPRPVAIAAKAELFEARGVKRLLSWWLRSMGQVPMDRQGGGAALAGLTPMARILQAGGVVGIAPEGTRSPDGRIYRGHTGVARLALATGAPVYPIGTRNTRIRRRLFWPTLRDASFVVGPPLDFSPWRGQADDPAVWRWATDAVMTALQAINGLPYLDVYATRVKKGEITGAALEAYVRPHPGGGTAPPPTDAELAAARAADVPPTGVEAPPEARP